MKRKNRTLLPAVETAALSLRVAGMSERGIYERMRDTLKEPPSYRDLRAAFASGGVRFRREAAAKRKAGQFFEDREKPIESSGYRGRLKDLKTFDHRPEAKDEFDDKYLLGYLARAHFAKEDLADEAFAERLDKIYDGEGS